MTTNQQKLDETWESQGRVEKMTAQIAKDTAWLVSPEGRAALLNHGIQDGDGKGVTSIAHSVRYSGPRSENVRKEVLAARAETAALREVVGTLARAGGSGIDVEALLDRVGNRIGEEIAKGIPVEITVGKRDTTTDVPSTPETSKAGTK